MSLFARSISLIGALIAVSGCGGDGVMGTMNATREPLAADIGFKKAIGRSTSKQLHASRGRVGHAYGRKNKRPLVVMSGDRSRKLIALTFDDSPYPKWTPKLLDTLRLLNVHATFFCIGSSVAKHPSLAKEIVNQGHEIGNHSYSHVDLAWLADGQVEAEMAACSEAIHSATGKTPTLIRPPGGNYDEAVLDSAKRLGLTMVFWSANVGDYRRKTSEAVLRIATERTKPGAIVLMHDGVQTTLDALPSYVLKMRSLGYRFVTVSELIKAKGHADDAGRLSYAALGIDPPER